MKRICFVIVIATSFVTLQSCEKEESAGPVDCGANPVGIDLVSVGDSNCGATDGSIEVSASGGSGTYTFKIDGNAGQTGSVFTGIGAGMHTVTAVDDNDCEATIEVSVKNVNGLNIALDTSPSGCKGSAGSLTVSATDGTEPYAFKINNGSFSANNVFANLSSGEYNLVVTDASGCQITQSVTIASGVSFASSISPLISTKCAVSGCHGGSQAPDFRVFKNIHDNAAQIKILTGNRTMPQQGSLTQAQIDMIACWVDDGAQQN